MCTVFSCVVVCYDPHLRWRLLDTHRPVWVSLLGHCSFLLGLGAQGSVCALKGLFPVLCKFWRLYGGVIGDVLQQSLGHTQVRCTQSPWGRPLLTRTSTGDTQTQFWLGLCGLGLRFVPFPGLGSLGEQVLGKRTVLGGPCVSVTSPVPAAQLPGYTARTLSQVGHVSQSPPQSLPRSSPGTPREHHLRCAACLLWRADGRL